MISPVKKKKSSKLEFMEPYSIRPTGWIKAQIHADIDGFAGHLDELCSEASSDIFGINKVALGDPKSWWNGESEGNWMDGLVRMAYISEDETSIAKVRSYMERILKTQGEDGYIGVYKPEWRYSIEKPNGELWCQSRIFLAMLAYYNATARTDVLEAVKKALYLTMDRYAGIGITCSYFNNGDPGGGTAHGLMIVEPLLELYDITGDRRLLDFAERCYEDYSKSDVVWKGADCQIDNLLNISKPFIGHGVHTCEHLRIPLMLYCYSGKEQYKAAFENGWRKMKKCMGVSGACKSDECIGSSDAPGFALPSAGYEYCTITELVLTLHMALMVTGESEYADMAERIILNAAQASRLSDGKGIAYLGSDNQYKAAGKIGNNCWDYSPTHDDTAVCCVPNAVRIMPYHISRMWMKTQDGALAALFYGPCSIHTQIDGTNIEIEEFTNYPFDEDITFRVKTSSEISFPLKLRIPDWSSYVLICVNGLVQSAVKENGYYTIDRIWEDGDELKVTFSMKTTAIKAIDGTIAVQRGPLVYALNIPAEKTYTRSYPIEDFHDIDFQPFKDACWDYTLKIDDDNEELGFTVHKAKSLDNMNPWDTTPVWLGSMALNWSGKLVPITLIPLGCTILRRTTFPYVVGWIHSIQTAGA